ncbi:kinase-like domain-containing protein [Gigaspora rosea]|uniref:Kinase-like domain-containing protein n=1 Tax=Gigaspora rosea TaxID=44941 RepID=A0A397VGI3_9GLOM|nr:kinase-like domain-containing protein [Gigaspora rosea]
MPGSTAALAVQGPDALAVQGPDVLFGSAAASGSARTCFVPGSMAASGSARTRGSTAALAMQGPVVCIPGSTAASGSARTRGINKLADNYQNGISMDERKTFELYLKEDEMGNAAGTCNMEDAAGTCNVGYCYFHGIGVETNTRKAHKYFQKAAKMGDIYALGIGIEEMDAKRAFEYYLKSVEMGDFKGIRQVGYCYLFEKGVKKYEHKEFEYCQKSADMGDVIGTLDVGYCYENGIGVKENKYKAFEYCKKSADMGDAMGIYTVGLYYHYGKGVIKDEREAFEYFKKSAEMGFADGMYRVGEFYQKGLIVEKNIDIAFEWYLKSAITEQNTIDKKKEYFHWIPFKNFENVEVIGKGAFSTVFKTKYLNNSGSYEEVAIKLVKDSNKNREPFIKELKACHSLNQYLGISRDEKTKDYILVLSYAKYGSLSKNLTDIFKFEWKLKLKMLHDIISNLNRIHSKEYLHRDIHPGNILLKEDYKAYITDLDLSKPFDEKEQKERIHGVLSYIAPELFQKQPYTQASDIYSFGIIMVEITTGQRPFNNYKFDNDLVIKICNGLRPKFGPGTPDCYIELANQCMDSNPGKRPTSSEIINKINEWLNIIESEAENKIKKRSMFREIIIKLNKWSNIFRRNKRLIKRQFLESDKINEKLPIIKENLKDIYTSKPYNIIDINKSLSKLKISKTAVNIEVTDDQLTLCIY